MVPGDLFWGPFQAQGTIMFGLYLLGAVSAMVAAWVFKRIVGRGTTQLPFYMEMPSYRLPSLRTVVIAVWDSCKAFLKKVSGIIMVVTIVLWALLNFPTPSEDAMTAAGVDVGDDAAVTAYTLDNSYAAGIGRAVCPRLRPARLRLAHQHRRDQLPRGPRDGGFDAGPGRRGRGPGGPRGTRWHR